MGEIRSIAAALSLSAAGLVGIATYEGFRDETYIDSAGVPTIGFGTTHGVRTGDTISPERALARLLADSSVAGQGVARCTSMAITQEQYDALVSFTYNVGVDAYCKSTLVRKLNAGDCWGAGKEFSRWVYAGGKVVGGLVSRRADERKLFEKGCEEAE